MDDSKDDSDHLQDEWQSGKAQFNVLIELDPALDWRLDSIRQELEEAYKNETPLFPTYKINPESPTPLEPVIKVTRAPNNNKTTTTTNIPGYISNALQIVPIHIKHQANTHHSLSKSRLMGVPTTWSQTIPPCSLDTITLKGMLSMVLAMMGQLSNVPAWATSHGDIIHHGKFCT
jgi:hypothetical protein